MISLSEPIWAWYFGILAFVLGSVLGSFLNCMAWRTAHHENVFKGRSHCTGCGHTLSFFDLIPIASWIFCGGKCRYCKEKISVRYLITEVFLGAMFVWILFSDGLTVLCIRDLIFVCILFTISLIDIEIYEIPDKAHIISIALFLATLYFVTDKPLKMLGYGAMGMFLLGGGILLVSLALDKILGKDTLGGGDIKLIGVCGLYLGPLKTLFGLILACIIGIIIGIACKKTGRKENEEEAHIPFGPAISAAMVIMLLAGGSLESWYLSLL